MLDLIGQLIGFGLVVPSFYLRVELIVHVDQRPRFARNHVDLFVKLEIEPNDELFLGSGLGEEGGDHLKVATPISGEDILHLPDKKKGIHCWVSSFWFRVSCFDF